MTKYTATDFARLVNMPVEHEGRKGYQPALIYPGETEPVNVLSTAEGFTSGKDFEGNFVFPKDTEGNLAFMTIEFLWNGKSFMLRIVCEEGLSNEIGQPIRHVVQYSENGFNFSEFTDYGDVNWRGGKAICIATLLPEQRPVAFESGSMAMVDILWAFEDTLVPGPLAPGQSPLLKKTIRFPGKRDDHARVQIERDPTTLSIWVEGYTGKGKEETKRLAKRTLHGHFSPTQVRRLGVQFFLTEEQRAKDGVTPDTIVQPNHWNWNVVVEHAEPAA